MKIKDLYFYLFYKFYKFGEWSPSVFPSDFTATLAISGLEVLFLGALKFYYIEFVNQSSTFKLWSFETLIPLLAIVHLNYFAFIDNNRWKKYFQRFDKFPDKKNLIGTWVVIGIVVFVIANVVLAFHIMSIITGIK